MDEDIVKKYKNVLDGSGYSIVYSSEGKDDPYGDATFISTQELSGETMIFQVGEVTMESTMEDHLEKVFDDYAGKDEAPAGMSAYGKGARDSRGGYEAASKEVLSEDDEEDEESEDEED